MNCAAGRFRAARALLRELPLQARLRDWMEKTRDPMLEAFLNKTDRAVVDSVMRKTYGPQKTRAPRKQRRARRQPSTFHGF